MAYSGTVAVSYHGTITAGSVDTVNFTNGAYRVRVYNHGTAALYFRPNTIGTANPTSGADDSFVVPASTTSPSVFAGRDKVTSVKLISAAAVTYAVEGLGTA